MSAELEAREALDWLNLAGLGVGALAEAIRDEEGFDRIDNSVLGLTFALEALGHAIKHRAAEAGELLAKAPAGQRGGSSGDALDHLTKTLGTLSPQAQRKLRKPVEKALAALAAATVTHPRADMPAAADHGAGERP